MDSCSVRSHLQPQDHFHETDYFNQNLRQKVVNRGLCVCAGSFTFVQRGLDIHSWQKLHWFTMFHISIWGSLELCLGGISLPNPRGDGNGFTSKLAPHSLSPVPCWEFSEAGYADCLIVYSIWRSTYAESCLEKKFTQR